MTTDEIRKAVKREPFEPFTLHLASGRKVHVPHPDYILAPPNARIIVVYDEKDHTNEHFDLLLIESIEYRKNGRSEQRRRRSA